MVETSLIILVVDDNCNGESVASGNTVEHPALAKARRLKILDKVSNLSTTSCHTYND